MDTRFHCVYLLTSHDPKYAGWFYIGYSVHPLRRLRQHNGELVAGARRTSRKGRPWGLVCCVSGFPEDRAALRFEWTWQHPFQAAMLRKSAATAPVGSLIATQQQPRPHDTLDNLKGLTRLNFAVGVLHLLLGTEPFKSLALRLNVLDSARFHQAAGWVHRKGLSPIQPTPSLIVAETSVAELKLLIGNLGGNLLGEEADEECDNGVDSSNPDGGANPNVVPLPTSGGDLSMMSFSSDVGLAETAHQRRKVVAAEMREQQLEAAGMLACTLCGLPVAPTTSGFKCVNGDMTLLATTPPLQVATVGGAPSSQPTNLTRDHFCPMRAHVVCLGRWFNHHNKTLEVFPTKATNCPLCSEPLTWSVLVQQLKQRIQRRKAQQQAEQKSKQRAGGGVAKPIKIGEVSTQQSARGKRNRDEDQAAVVASANNEDKVPEPQSKFKTSFANSSRRFDAVVAARVPSRSDGGSPVSQVPPSPVPAGPASKPLLEKAPSKEDHLDDFLNW